jgi:hypothetical protein
MGFVAGVFLSIMIIEGVIIALLVFSGLCSEPCYTGEDGEDEEDYFEEDEELPDFPFYATVTAVPTIGAAYLEVGSKVVILGEISNSQYDDFVGVFTHTGASFTLNRDQFRAD